MAKFIWIGSAALLAGMMGSHLVSAQGAAVQFARQVVALMNEGEVAEVVAKSTPHTVTCPGSGVNPTPICDGVADGTEVPGYLFGVLAGEPGFYDAADYAEGIEEFVALFGGAELRLYTIAEGVLQTGHQCGGCFIAVASTEEEADRSDGLARMLVFQAEPTEQGPVVTGFFSGLLGGDDARIHLRGGQLAFFKFVPVDGPAPPAVGTGLAEGPGFDVRVAAIGLLVLAAALWAASRRSVA